MLPRKFLIHHHIHTKSTQPLSLVNSEIFLIRILTITSNSGTAPAIKTSHYTQQLINIPKALTYYWASLANHLGTFIRNMIVIRSFHNRECPFKRWITKEKTFSNFAMMNPIFLNHWPSRAVPGFNTLVIQIYYMLKPLELLLIIHLLVNTN